MTLPDLTRASDASSAIDSDRLTAVLLAEGEDAPRALAPAEADRLERLAAALGAAGRKDEVVRGALEVDGALAPIVFLGVGELDEAETAGAFPDAQALLRAGGALGRARPEAERVALLAERLDAAGAEAFATGYLLGAYRFDRYKGGEPRPEAPVLELAPAAPAGEDGEDGDGGAIDRALERACAIAAGVATVRDLVNTPPNDLGPADFAAIAEEAAGRIGCEVRVWDERELEAEGFGGHIGVGKGSARPPRLVRIAYRPEGASRHIALVGKGITFDTGGLSLKPAASMLNMKTDMAGAATILGVLEALAALETPVSVTGWLCMAENMPSGEATRPDDVITLKGGTTVEVTNTDAEGRLVLGDGLAAASEDELPADAIIDIATLTGAQLVALGDRTTGVMGNDDDLIERLLAAAAQAGEPAWPMPIPEEIAEPLKSDVADIANARPGNRNGGMLMAAAFLERFVGERADGSPIPWAHLDIAGPAFNDGKPHGASPKGATGAMVRTLVAALEAEAARA